MAGSRLVAALLVAALLVVGCGSIGAATTRIDQAEAEIDELLAALVAELDLEVVEEVRFGPPRRCDHPAFGDGLSNTRSLRATLATAEDRSLRTSVLLGDAGYVVNSADRGEGVFAGRDGIRIAVLFDDTGGRTEIDANTGCRPPPAG